MKKQSRRLSRNESAAVKKELLRRWNFTGFFWPAEERENSSLLTLAKNDIPAMFYEEVSSMVKLHTGQVYELNESGLVAEVSADHFHPDAYETVFCDKTMDWIMYNSHDGTISFGGGWLLGAVYNAIDHTASWKRSGLGKMSK